MDISLYIVEDYLLTRVGLRHVIKKFDNVELLGDFASAEECMEAMTKKPADVILMDIGLPGMNGIEATRLIKKQYPATKIIFLTSHENEEEVLAGLSAGANAYCLKEAESEYLLDIIKMVHSGALWLAPQIAKVPFQHLPAPQSDKLDNLYPKLDQNFKLTKRELTVLGYIAQGMSNPQIAEQIIVSTHTAKAHVASILMKLEVTDRVQAAVKAIKYNLL